MFNQKRLGDTVLEQNPFFLWEFNVGKMDEKKSLMINQWQALKDQNKYFTKKAINVEEKSFNLDKNRKNRSIWRKVRCISKSRKMIKND